MSWCERNRVGYVFGLAKNERLLKKVRKPMQQACAQWKRTAKPARVFTEFRYRTRETWSRARRVTPNRVAADSRAGSSKRTS